MSQALYRKWRPRQWDEVVGQEHIVLTLRNAIRSERVGHAYLFAGPRGTGKTTTARLLAKAVNCLVEELNERPCNQCAHCLAVNEGRFLDLIEIDAASNTSVEDVRNLRDKINFSPNQGRYKVYIIDEVHMLSTAAFNALLKTLEEPPPHAIFILATTEVHKIPATVLSRCQRHEFRRIPVDDIFRHLKSLAEQEGLQADPEALKLIARQATGSLRDGISLLDQLASSTKEISLDLAHAVLGTATNQVVIELVEAVQAKDAAAGFNQIHRALDAGTDPRQFARQVVEYLRGLLLIRMGNANQVEATQDVRIRMAKQAQGFDANQIVAILRNFNNAVTDTRGGWHPGLLLELAFAESISERTAAAPTPASIQNSAPTPQRSAPSAVLEAAPSPGDLAARPASTSRQAPAELGEEIRPDRPATSPAKPISQAPAETLSEKPQSRVEPASVPTTQPAAPSGGISYQNMLRSWQDVRTLVRKHYAPTSALLNSGKPLGFKEGKLVLGTSQFVKEKIETGEHLEIISRAIAHVTGVQMEVRCVLLNDKDDSMPADLDVDSDGMIGTALRDLGGKVVDVQ